MRGSYQWAMVRLAVLAAFVIPAALIKPNHGQIMTSGSWLAVVEMTAPILALHQPESPAPALPAEVVAKIKQSAALASQAQQEAMQALRKELIREIIRARSLRTEASQRQARG